MQGFSGFLLGVVASAGTGLALWALTHWVPWQAGSELSAWLRHPVGKSRWLTPRARPAREQLATLYTAWATGDTQSYRASWSPTASRVSRQDGGLERFELDAITRRFEDQIARWSRVRTEYVVTDYVTFEETHHLVQVEYRMRLLDKGHDVPLIEEGVDVFRFAVQGGRAEIVSNFDESEFTSRIRDSFR